MISLTIQFILSVPILLTVAGLVLVFGQDHPAGAWSDRHTTVATAISERQGHHVHYSSNEKKPSKGGKDCDEEKTAGVSIVQVNSHDDGAIIDSTVDIAVNETLTVEGTRKLLASPLTWLPAFAYLTTFGVELAIDSVMAGALFTLYNKHISGFTQTTAGYYTSIL